MAAAGFGGIWLAATVLRSGDSVENVSIEGLDVGGLSETQIRAQVVNLATDFAARPLPILTPGGTIADTTTGQLGFAIDVEANVDAALAAGQTGASPIAWVSSFFGEQELNAVVRWDESAALRYLEGFETVLIRNSEPARLELRDGVYVVDPGLTGSQVTAADVLAALRRAAVAKVPPEVLVVEPSTTPPAVTAVDLQATADDVNTRTARGMAIHVGDVIRDFVPYEVRSWLTVTPGAEPLISLDTGYVTQIIEERLANIATPGHPGTFTVIDGVPTAQNPVPARRCCAPNAGEAVLTALRSGYQAVRLHLADVPDSGGDLVAQTGIRELVGEFTTYYTPGQSRVTNIRRIAELVQGAIIEPGGSWSANDYVGRRTIEKGFVAGGVIYKGKFQSDVGGGVSQFATTLFNAAFFAGLDFEEYAAHSIYLSRYPYGREATISYPHPDLKLVNNTPYSVLLWPTSTENSVTVQIYSTAHMTVIQSDQWTEAEDQCTKVFTERTRTFADGSTVTDIVRARYQPGEGLTCAGEPVVPPPECEPGQGPVDTDNDGWHDSCRALCPTADSTGDAGTGVAPAPADGPCVTLCPEGTTGEVAPDGTPCVPICDPDDTEALPGSCVSLEPTDEPESDTDAAEPEPESDAAEPEPDSEEEATEAPADSTS